MTQTFKPSRPGSDGAFSWRRMAAALLPLTLLWAVPAWGQNSIRLDDFTKTYPVNKTAPDWDSTKISPLFGSGDKYFFQFVHKSDQEHYVHVVSGDNNSFGVGSEKSFNLPEYTVLEWEWKVTKIPKGGDVRVKKKDDQAGSICVVVDPGLTFDSSMCYLWENDGPKDKPITSTKSKKAKYLILRTPKTDTLGKWYKEKRNIYADYKRLFGREPDDKAVIAMQIDSDDTETSGEAFYRNIILHKR